DWTGWEQVASVVYPGQSAQRALHPILTAAPFLIDSKEVGRLQVELEYVRGGEKKSQTVSERITILGQNDVAYGAVSPTELPEGSFYHTFQEVPVVLTAFITPNDPVVKDVKGLLSKRIGGVPTTTPEGALAMAKAIHDFFRVNLAYSSPTGALDERG